MKTSLYVILFCLCLSAPALATVWSDPVLLTELNDSFTGHVASDPFLTADGLTMYFCRAGNDTNSRIMMATRDSVSDPFTSISEVTDLYVGKRIYSPWVSADGLRMYYNQHENSTLKDMIHMAARASINDPWQDVMTFTDIHNLYQYNAYLSLTPDELTLYYSAPNPESYMIWMATRTSIGDQFSSPVAVTELNDGSYASGPYIMPDNLTIFYDAVRDGYPTLDLYMAARSSASDPFGNIERLNISSDSINDFHPYVSADYTTLYFSTAGGIWMSQQVPEPATCLLVLAGGLLLRKK